MRQPSLLSKVCVTRGSPWPGLVIILVCSTSLFAQAGRATQGEWSAVETWPNVAIHAHLLPNGKVLFWGRRETGEGLDDSDTSIPIIWDPEANTFVKTADTPGYNLFCSGHTFMADGKLFVAGGHRHGDGQGEPFASTYDYLQDKWERIPKLMKGGRWYPTATTLSDGGILVSFGTNEDTADNVTQQIWKDGNWTQIVNFEFPGGGGRIPPYYPRMHVLPDGNVFMTGPLALTQILAPRAAVPGQTLPGDWMFLRPDLGVAGSERLGKGREYACSVMYGDGKVIFVGGGNPPSADCEIVDVTAADRRWKTTGKMTLARRQHNATLLPDGTVLVMGGTKGDGNSLFDNDATKPPPNAVVPAGPGVRFNDLRPGQPLRSAEVWNPNTGQWRRLARASVDRCYHSIALLLADGRVLSAGGGEYRPYDTFFNNKNENHPSDSHLDAQIFSPPYLFAANGAPAVRPVISSAPSEVQYGAEFAIQIPNAPEINRVSCIRLGSVTHAFDAGQRINVLPIVNRNAGSVSVTAPENPKLCPPGHYLLFILNQLGVPSISKIIRIGS